MLTRSEKSSGGTMVLMRGPIVCCDPGRPLNELVICNSDYGTFTNENRNLGALGVQWYLRVALGLPLAFSPARLQSG